MLLEGGKHMSRRLGLLSVLLFVVSALVYIITMFITGDLFSGPVMLIVEIVLPIIGLFLAFKSSGGFKIIGIVGNVIILFIAGIIPAISTFFWNTP